MKKLDHKIALECVGKLSEDIDTLNYLDKKIVLSYSQYEKYRITYGKGAGVTYSNVAEYPYGIELATGDHIFFKPMRGFKLHLNETIDVYLTLLEEDDILAIANFK